MSFVDRPNANYLHDFGPLFISAVPVDGAVIGNDAVHILGLPTDTGASFRSGTRSGPRYIRYFSHSLETYSRALDRDLEDLQLIDRGDIAVRDLKDAELAEEIAEAVSALSSGRVILLGGDHSASIGAIAAVYKRHPELRVIHIDAHLDQREEYDGTKYSHACPMRRVSELLGDGRLIQLGIRSGSREEWAAAEASDMYLSSELSLPDKVVDDLRGHPIYVSLDIDVLDPSVAPGVGDPEPGGVSYRQLEDLVHSLKDLNVVSCDVMETDPLFDPSGITSTAAAKIAREMMLSFWGS